MGSHVLSFLHDMTRITTEIEWVGVNEVRVVHFSSLFVAAVFSTGLFFFTLESLRDFWGKNSDKMSWKRASVHVSSLGTRTRGTGRGREVQEDKDVKRKENHKKLDDSRDRCPYSCAPKLVGNLGIHCRNIARQWKEIYGRWWCDENTKWKEICMYVYVLSSM